jgi:hypothetical protein
MKKKTVISLFDLPSDWLGKDRREKAKQRLEEVRKRVRERWRKRPKWDLSPKWKG